jgi:hypothetical protein
MKKLILVLVISLTAGFVSAQAAADKSIQAGLVTGFGLNFQNMGTENIATNGVGTDLTIGANVNFSFTETIGLTTGIEFDFEKLKYQAGNQEVYYRYNDKEILTEADGTDNQIFQLTSREQKPVYLSIPTMILFRTNFIGYFRYFGKFGLRNSFLLSNNINDSGFDSDQALVSTNDADPANSAENAVFEATLEQTTKDGMKAAGEMFFFKSSVGLAGGAEWNFTGSTCLVAEIGYYYGFTPLHSSRNENKQKEFLYTNSEDPSTGNYNKNHFSNQATQGQLMFKLSVLF